MDNVCNNCGSQGHSQGLCVGNQNIDYHRKPLWTTKQLMFNLLRAMVNALRKNFFDTIISICVFDLSADKRTVVGSSMQHTKRKETSMLTKKSLMKYALIKTLW
ncbi:Hypothetical predicted protein [Octopus vulgaris]|uniref:Uncharacterized protein n=1 Tax=Octopus vulgaris TaxID=6645 RepID=A0AA36BA14_OCTVU|nr:Hypothetical predicted protein [Octopus vulgaris]